MNPTDRNPNAKTGRPRVLDRSARGIVGLLTSLGYNQKTVANLVGCAPCTIRREVLRNPEFSQELSEARHGAEVNLIHDIVQAASTRPDAARWLRNQIQTSLEQMRRPQSTAGSTVRSQPPSFGFLSAQNPLDFCALSDDDFFGKSGFPIERERAIHKNNFSTREDAFTAGRRKRSSDGRAMKIAESAKVAESAHRPKKTAKIGRSSKSTHPHRKTKTRLGRNA
jgi:hypothetical protein